MVKKNENRKKYIEHKLIADRPGSDCDAVGPIKKAEEPRQIQEDLLRVGFPTVENENGCDGGYPEKWENAKHPAFEKQPDFMETSR